MSLCVYVCECIWVYAQTHAFVQVYMHVCGGQRSALTVILEALTT